MSLISGLAALAAASTLSTQATPLQERPETLARLMACRGIAENTARLACFDTAAGALDTAERQGDLVVIDRAGVAETRRQLFGFEMPSLPRLFGPEGAVELESIDSTLQSAASVGEGRWVFRLADGSVWRQIDSERVRFRNSPGQPVRVRKGALSSFLLTVDGSRAVRVRRQ
jgi:nucleoside phosphorylase